ncbi:peptide-methionine (S)-S-oxide reductase [Christiangramia fulva]|uniref:Peptide methionine sulfoxide reductase MsrA n=1 Tax=Christiangramia fulva TaxID=2126553 RepID=A0A2R3ZAJ7_9FLAO|nr:peptide-methionine (S)-S-oxide reductase MsrA [Christiangramia fulva]AVR47287.1 peptide-methionine (S)-S-oxide reductase [Christiangramia fulva]
MKFLLINFLSLLLLGCNNSAGNSPTPEALVNAEPVEVPAQNGLEHAYFSSGCFWCVEAIYESVKGVKEAISGYAGGEMKNPTYENSDGHAETVEVIYDPDEVSFKTLVQVYFGSQDPTQVNGQGPDIGKHYRSIIFYQNEKQKQIIEEVKAEVAKKYDKPIAAEILPFQKFWKAEDYHQNYEKNHPENPYIQNVSIPRINRFKEKFPDLLKEKAH